MRRITPRGPASGPNRCPIWEVVMVGIGVSVVAYAIGAARTESRLYPFLSPHASELPAIEARYGPQRNSERGEEWIVRDFFQDERGGVFVDVGANDAQRASNTYYLETALGWSGIAIEPQVRFAAGYQTKRPLTTFVPLFVTDRPNTQAVLFVPPNDLMASANDTFAHLAGGPAESRTVDATTLDDILTRTQISRIDFLSIDVEMHEPEVLRGFSLRTYRPRLVAIEAYAPVRQPILDYFAEGGYVVLGAYLRADHLNLWFAPLDR